MRFEILCPIYVDFDESDLKRSLKAMIRRLILDLDIEKIDIVKIGKRFIVLDVEGKHEHIAYTYLTKIMGKKLSNQEIEIGEEYSGRVGMIDERGIFLDIGQEEDTKVIIPIGKFLGQIIGRGIRKIDNKKIVERMGIDRYFPIVIRVEKIEEKSGQKKVMGNVGRRTVVLFKNWFGDRLDRVVVYGELRSRLDRIIKRTALHRKIVKIERLGLLEHVIICRYGIFADEIAKILEKNAIDRIKIFMPRRLKKLIKSRTMF